MHFLPKILLSLGIFIFGFMGASEVARADIVLDGSTGSRGSIIGPDYEVPASAGRRAGANLFHSFKRFNILRGETATFLGPAGIDNVIGRVTGGEISRINGVLRSTVPFANFWLMNPSGVVFGDRAALDVRGSFYVSTADELRFSDDTVLATADGTSGSFTTAPPEAFGFIGGRPGDIVVNGGVLEVNSGSSISFVGGDVTIAGTSSLEPTLSQGRVSAPEGQVHLFAVGDEPLMVPPEGMEAARGSGTVVVKRFGRVEAEGNGGGAVRVSAEELQLKNESSISTRNLGDANAEEGVEVVVGSLTMSGLTSQIRSDASGSGDAGSIVITASKLLMDGSDVLLNAGATSGGRGGSIEIKADEVFVRGGRISTTASSAGNSGPVTIEATTVLLKNGHIDTVAGFPPLPPALPPPPPLDLFVEGEGDLAAVRDDKAAIRPVAVLEGDAGPVSISAERLVIKDGGSVTSSGLAAGSGGAITIEAETMVLSHGFINSSALGSGDGGLIRALGQEITLIDGAQISASTANSGEGGEIRIEASGDVLIAGRDGAGAPSGIRAASETSFDNSIQPGQTPGSGDAGRVVIRADRLEMRSGGEVSVASEGAGSAGRVEIETARSVEVGPGSSINATAAFSDGGQVLINTGEYVHLRGSAVETTLQGRDSIAELVFDTPVLVLDSALISLNSMVGPDFAFTNNLLASPDSDIRLNAAPLNLGDISSSLDLEALTVGYIDATKEMRDGCGGRRREGSSLTARGGGGLLPEPGAPLSGSYVRATDHAAAMEKPKRLRISGFVLACSS